MTPLFKKLNLRDQPELHVLDAPSSLEPELRTLAPRRVLRSVSGPVRFALVFVKTLREVETAAARLAAAASGDAVLWFAYPKASSKNHRCEFNRDTGWAALGAAGYEAVRQVAIDADWSALRFRRVEHIKTMQRAPANAISAAGRRRTLARPPRT